jgi:hypothetical protein
MNPAAPKLRQSQNCTPNDTQCRLSVFRTHSKGESRLLVDQNQSEIARLQQRYFSRHFVLLFVNGQRRQARRIFRWDPDELTLF